MPKITEMFAFVVADKGPDDEGVVAAFIGGTWLPLVGADMARVKALVPAARGMEIALKKKIKLLHFTQREELDFPGK